MLQVSQGRPHLLCDMRLVNDQGQQLPHDGAAVGHLQVGCSTRRQPRNLQHTGLAEQRVLLPLMCLPSALHAPQALLLLVMPACAAAV